MIAEQLKKSILQAAIQGKLTEQLLEDGDAQKILEDIVIEKTQLAKEGKLKIGKQYSAIKEEEIPFDIPENWVWCKLNEIAFVTKLAGFEYTEYIAPNLSSSGIPLFKGKNIKNGSLVIDFESYIPDSVSNKLKRSQLSRKCLLTPYVGTIGNIAIFNGDFKAHLGSNVGKIELFNYLKTNILEEYLLLFLLSNTGLLQLSKYKKSTAQESISIEAIRDVLVSIPPLTEQYRIVNHLDEMFREVEKLKNDETKLDNLQNSFPKKMKDSILQYAIQGKLTKQLPEDGDARNLLKLIKKTRDNLINVVNIKPEQTSLEVSENDIPFDIPENWCWTKLVNVGDIIGGGTPKTDEKLFWQDGNIAWLTPADMKNVKGMYVEHGERCITELGLKNSSATLLPKGSVLFSSRAPIGYLAIANKPLATNQGFKSVIPFLTKMSEYIYYYLMAITPQIENMGSGTTFKEVSGGVMKQILIPLPPLTEQARIIDLLKELLPLCDTLE